MISGIQKDRICGLRPDSVHVEQLLTQGSGGRAKHSCQRRTMVLFQKADEGFQFPGFLAKISGGADMARESCLRDALNGRRVEQVVASQIANRSLHVGPTGVLRQYGSYNNLKARSSRPPMLRPARGIESFKVRAQYGLRRWLRRQPVKLQVLLSQGFPVASGLASLARKHHFWTIAMGKRQVKNETLYQAPASCSCVQVLHNSQRWFKFERRVAGLFAMVSFRCTVFRECCGCPSVWAKY
jgi:hypothetical protein